MEDDGRGSHGSYGGGGGGNKNKRSSKPKPPPKPAPIIKVTSSDAEFPTDLPYGTKDADFDWDDVIDIIREVIQQGDRRTCWTIASTRSLSARLIIEKKCDRPLCLSALHVLVGLIDRVDSTGGLQNLQHLQQFLIDHGTILEEDCSCPQLALEAKNDNNKPNPVMCTEQNKAKAKHVRTFKVKSLIISDENKVDERELIRLVQKGPVAASIDVHDEFIKFKGDGIYRGPNKDKELVDRHMFLVKGYGTKMPEGIHYWKVQNSAGPKWGDKGCGKIIRQISRKSGQPSLFTRILYPVLLDHYER